MHLNKKNLPSPGFHLPVSSACLLAAFSASSIVASIWMPTMALRSSSWLIWTEHMVLTVEEREKERREKTSLRFFEE